MCTKIKLPLEQLAELMRPFMLGDDKREHAWHIGRASNLDFDKLDREFAYHYCDDEGGDTGLYVDEKIA
jgi:hypothetical protein